MGRTVYWMNVSLDLRIESHPGEDGGGDWMRIGQALHEEFNTRVAQMAMLWQGRVIHEIMEDFWPVAAEDESLQDFLRDYGRIWTDMPKVLVSNTRTDAGHNTRIVSGDDDPAPVDCQFRRAPAAGPPMR